MPTERIRQGSSHAVRSNYHLIIQYQEQQSMLDADRKNKTRQDLTLFNPILTLLYSITNSRVCWMPTERIRQDSSHAVQSNYHLVIQYQEQQSDVYNQVYHLDAINVFNNRLVKKIEVKGVKQVGTTSTNSYLYLYILSTKKSRTPRARINFDATNKTSLCIQSS